MWLQNAASLSRRRLRPLSRAVPRRKRTAPQQFSPCKSWSEFELSRIGERHVSSRVSQVQAASELLGEAEHLAQEQKITGRVFVRVCVCSTSGRVTLQLTPLQLSPVQLIKMLHGSLLGSTHSLGLESDFVNAVRDDIQAAAHCNQHLAAQNQAYAAGASSHSPYLFLTPPLP